MSALRDFVRESNRIEGILRDSTDAEVDAHGEFLRCPKVLVAYLEKLVLVLADQPLRDKRGLDVYVGEHQPPPGGPPIRRELGDLCDAVNSDHLTPYETHVRYELLHPFMDGNGRSGRALWLWQMQRDVPDPFVLPFLHRFYYQTLDAASSAS